MKGTFGFIFMIFMALMLLTVVGGTNNIFSSIAQTWTTDQTAQIANGLAQVLWLGGIVGVMVLGLYAYNIASKGGGGGRRQPQQQDQQYMISDGSMPPMPAQQQKMLTADVEGDWYEIEPAKQRQLV